MRKGAAGNFTYLAPFAKGIPELCVPERILQPYVNVLPLYSTTNNETKQRGEHPEAEEGLGRTGTWAPGLFPAPCRSPTLAPCCRSGAL